MNKNMYFCRKYYHMDTSDIKVGMIELITRINDKELLVQLYLKMKEVIDAPETSEYTLTKEQKAELLLSFEDSFKEENLFTQQEAQNLHSKWLKG